VLIESRFEIRSDLVVEQRNIGNFDCLNAAISLGDAASKVLSMTDCYRIQFSRKFGNYQTASDIGNLMVAEIQFESGSANGN